MDPPSRVVCTGSVDIADLFARHAKAFGGEAEVAKSLPLTMRGTVSVSGKEGTYEESLDSARSKSAIHLKGLERASGIDENGAWKLGNSGGISRIRANETRATDEWILRRHYLSAFKTDRDVAVCQVNEGKKRIIVEIRNEELGRPRLVFDADTAELVGSEFESVDGHMSTRTVTWGPKNGAGASWPTHSTGVTEGESNIEMTIEKIEPAAPDAFAVPAPFLAFTWPKSDVVKVPMKLYGGEIVLDLTVGGKKTRALLDSGAGISVVEAGGRGADSFTPEVEFEGQSATQKIRFGIGKLADVQLGSLTIKNIPGARVPIPMFDQFGPNRPDVVLGWSLFEGNAVRVDYAKNELVFSHDAAALHGPNATSIDIRTIGDKVIAKAELGTKDVPEAGDSGAHGGPAAIDSFQIDTGNAFSISLSAAWAKKHKFPGPYKQIATMRGQFSAGTDVTATTYYRSSYVLGPIMATRDFIEITDGPGTGIIAGLLGNLVLAKCQAIVFDVPQRKIWFDGPCDRTPQQAHIWWTLARSDDPRAKDHPWVVASTAAHGTANAAGIVAGDRVVEIDSKPVGLGFDFVAAFDRPVGTKLTFSVLREGKIKTLPATLVDPF